MISNQLHKLVQRIKPLIALPSGRPKHYRVALLRSGGPPLHNKTVKETRRGTRLHRFSTIAALLDATYMQSTIME